MRLAVSSRLLWSPDFAKLAAVAPPTNPNTSYKLGTHYDVVTRESGSTRHDIPIFASRPGLIQFEDPAQGEVLREEVEGVKGAFALSSVLTPAECGQLISVSEAMGYTEDAPVSLARNIRHNENCVWIADDSLWKPIFQRISHQLPQSVAGGALAGLNQRWRLYKYGPEDIFRLHTDGSWPGSVMRDGRLVQDGFQDRWSQLTLLLYLNDDYEGGETSFLQKQGQQNSADMVRVRLPAGSALGFFHGYHPLSPLHEGSRVVSGVKYILRSDILYRLPLSQPDTCSVEE